MIEAIESAEGSDSPGPLIIRVESDDWGRDGRHFEVEKFGGDFQKWPKFKEMFETFVHNNERKAAVAKFLRLDQSLVPDSEAAQTISGLPRTGDKYSVAWEQLCRAYDNKRKLVEDLIDRFLDFPAIKRPTRESLVSLINGTNHLLGSLPNYDICVSQWDSIVSALLMRKLDTATIRAWNFERPQREITVLAPFLEFL